MERLGFFFTANKITKSEEKRAILLTACEAPTHKLIRNLVSSRKTEEVPYNVIVATVKSYLNPKPSVILQMYRFNNRAQRPGESVADFVADLRRLSADCEYYTHA